MTNDGERWRPVASFEGRYEVSSAGRVRSVARWVAARGGKRLVEGRVLSPSISSGGYPRVTLTDGRRELWVNVHRLVAESFLSGESNQVVRHLDGNPANNAVENLAWGTFADNEADKLRHGRRPLGEAHPRSKMTDGHVRAIRDMSSRGISQLAIARALGLNRGVVGIVVRGEGWTHVR